MLKSLAALPTKVLCVAKPQAVLWDEAEIVDPGAPDTDIFRVAL